MKQIIEIEVPNGKKAVWKDNKVVFEDIKPQLPKTWEEFCYNNDRKPNEAFITNSSEIQLITEQHERKPFGDRNILPSKQAAKQHLALMQLHQLRDCYRQGWVPDYTSTFNKFCIVHYFDSYSYKHNYEIVVRGTIPRFLTFQSEKIAQEFLDNFRDLIEQAGDLI